MILSIYSNLCVAAIGDNCIDHYPRINRQYCTGNAVDFAVNMQQLGIPTSMISCTGNDENGKAMVSALNKQALDLSHFHIINGKTAVTTMDISPSNDRIHGDYDEGVLAEMQFSEDDIYFAANHTLVHSAFWGKAERYLEVLGSQGALISFDYATKFEDPMVRETLKFVNYAFFSLPSKNDLAKLYLQESFCESSKVLVATFGAKGSLAYDGKKFYEFGIFPAKVNNTIGAGDSFIAGFIYGILHQLDIQDCLKSGARQAAKVVEVFEPWLNY